MRRVGAALVVHRKLNSGLRQSYVLFRGRRGEKEKRRVRSAGSSLPLTVLHAIYTSKSVADDDGGFRPRYIVEVAIDGVTSRHANCPLFSSLSLFDLRFL